MLFLNTIFKTKYTSPHKITVTISFKIVLLIITNEIIPIRAIHTELIIPINKGLALSLYPIIFLTYKNWISETMFTKFVIRKSVAGRRWC